MLTSAEIQALAEAVQRDHRNRGTLAQQIPMQPRGPRRRKRPRTEIIATAAQRKAERRATWMRFLGEKPA